MARENKIKKVILLGSGSIKIGEAGEFDYSGSQAIKAMKEEKVETILINPNIATIQTSEHLADKVYFIPINPYFVEKVIQKENPDGILLSFGGQTALNCGVELDKLGILRKYDVKVLGTPVKSIEDTEDRDLFVKRLAEIGVKVPESFAVGSLNNAIKAAKKIGYPVMIRVAYALGGKGSGIAYNEPELIDIAKKAFSFSTQILVENYLGGWKEVEYEVVRDCYDNCITVCNMENFDPMGIHTGESIVVAPSQTLTNSEYHKLRAMSIKVIRHLGIIGECNIQIALDPKSEEYRVIEVNARLSRSSALASKATGYPLAFIAAKLALGYSLMELSNSITKKTMACFEPALDYIVVKIPRWDLQKFRRVAKEIGPEMKSVGEIMAIGRKFEETLQKAIRMLNIGMNGLVCNKTELDYKGLELEIKTPTDRRVFAIAEAIKRGFSIDHIYELSKIDKWFLYKIKNIVETEKKARKCKKISRMNQDLMLECKQQGFSDKQIGIMLNSEELTVRKARKEWNIIPKIKQIDTLAAEYPAKTNYLYVTYNGDSDDIEFSDKKQVIVLGSGVYRIGSSVEFDWCCVSTVLALKKLGYKTIMMNYNPETVSTDYDICDKLYFDELSFEVVADIYEKESPIGVIISMGGQIPNNIAMKCHENGIRILGTSPLSIDSAENRHKFSALLDELGIDQPAWKELTNIREARRFAKSVGYPVLIRPSYVLSGAAMNVALSEKDLDTYLKKAADVSDEYPVVISKFITNAKEIEIDAVASKGELIVWAISEHVENAGVHSGDATMVLPPQNTYIETIKRIKVIAKQIARSLKITGPFNIQFIAKENEVKVIECNLRASRSFPFVSKVSKVNFIDLATKAIMNKKIARPKVSILELDYVGVKAPQFSFSRLKGADPVLSVEMASTGEVACLGDDLEEAFLKSLICTGINIPRKNVLVSISGDENRYKLLKSIIALQENGFEIYATEHTSKFLDEHKIKNTMVYKAHNMHKKLNIITLLEQSKIGLVINIPEDGYNKIQLEDEYEIRRKAVDFGVPLLTNLQIARLFVQSILKYKVKDLKVKSWDEYK